MKNFLRALQKVCIFLDNFSEFLELLLLKVIIRKKNTLTATAIINNYNNDDDGCKQLYREESHIV